MQFTVGNVLGRSLGIWFKNLIAFTIIALVVFSPLILYTASVFAEPPTEKAMQTYTIVTGFSAQFLGLIVTGAVTYGVIRQLQGERVGLGECLRVGFGRMFPIFGVGFYVGLICMLGFLLLFFPGMYWLTMYWLAVPVAVVERPGVSKSAARSKELTMGHKWSVFGIIVVVFAISFFFSFVIELMFARKSGEPGIALYHWLVLLVTIVTTGALQPVCSAVAYHDLRVLKEGISVDELAKVFA